MTRTYRNMSAAVADPGSHAARAMARFDVARKEADRVIAEWMAQGFTREQAYTRALGRRS